MALAPAGRAVARTPVDVVAQDARTACNHHIALPNRLGDRTIWNENAMYSHPFWEDLRNLACRALTEFGWPQEKPPSYGHEYVRGKWRERR